MVQKGASSLLTLLRETDRERYLSVLFAPEGKRDALAALFLFNADVARVRDVISEPLPGEIRLQWWRDVFSGNRLGDAASHRFAPALIEATARYHLPPQTFDNLLEARIFDLYDDPMPSRTDLEGYLGETVSALFQMSCQILNEGDTAPVADAAGHGGVAFGIAQLIRRLPAHMARGQVYLQADLLAAAGLDAARWLASDEADRAGQGAAIDALVALGRDHLAKANTAVSELPASLRPPFAVLPLADVLLAKAGKLGHRVRSEPVGLSPITTQWRMTRFGLGW